MSVAGDESASRCLDIAIILTTTVIHLQSDIQAQLAADSQHDSRLQQLIAYHMSTDNVSPSAALYRSRTMKSYALYRIPPNQPIYEFCTVIRSFVAGTPRDFKFGL